MRTFISLKSRQCRTCQPTCSTAASTFSGTSKRNALVPWLIAVAFALIAQQARACSLTVTGVNFGIYDVFSNSALHSVGNIDMNCASGVGYTIAITAGNGTYQQRIMSSGANTLNYNLYTAANREFVWGDPTSGNATVSGSGTGMSVNHVVYGRIPALQNVRTGSYSDTITVVLSF
jgi:spore coat protein U-like protein